MKIEDILQSTAALSPAKKTVLNIFVTQNGINEKLIEVFKPFDLSAEQFNVLRILRGQKGKPANMSLIQDRMLAKTSNTTRLVDKLLLKGLVTREICPQNRRKMEVSITTKGLELLLEIDPKVEAAENNIVSMLDQDEMQTLNHLLEKLRTQ